MLMIILGVAVLLVGLILSLVLIGQAFKQGAGPGFMSLLVPGYLIYFAFAKYASPKKAAVVGSWLGALTIGTILVVVGTNQLAHAVVNGLNEIANMPTPADAQDAPSAAAADAPVMNCNLPDAHQCSEYRLPAAEATAQCSFSQLSDHPIAVAAGACPTENVIAKCDLGTANKVIYYYRDNSPGVDNNVGMEATQALCMGTFTRLDTH